MLCKKTYKNQITIPKKVMEIFDDVEYFNAEVRDGVIILEPLEISPRKDARLEKVRKKIADLGLTESDIENAVRWARKKRD